uniref:Hus1-like protein n=1 Tax=Arundo donax TaxID=35708 RepID=A0A0A9GA45_ARUDO
MWDQAWKCTSVVFLSCSPQLNVAFMLFECLLIRPFFLSLDNVALLTFKCLDKSSNVVLFETGISRSTSRLIWTPLRPQCDLLLETSMAIPCWKQCLARCHMRRTVRGLTENDHATSCTISCVSLPLVLVHLQTRASYSCFRLSFGSSFLQTY